MDDLFVRHTYLTAVIGMVVQASFGSDIYRLAETDPADLLHGRDFHNQTGLQGVVESDFFAWPTEVEGGLPLIETLARRVAKFDWQEAPNDIAAILYETVIPPDERRQLGEYYTPDWLARTIVRELVTDPLDQYCPGPGLWLGNLRRRGGHPLYRNCQQYFSRPQRRVGVAALLRCRHRRSPGGGASGPGLMGACSPACDTGSVQGRVRSQYHRSRLLGRRPSSSDFVPVTCSPSTNVTVQVEDEDNTELVFPVSLVERAETFDALMSDVAEAIEKGDDPTLALDDHQITDSGELQTLRKTIAAMQRLHAEGRNHIWAYYTRNLVRPVALSRSKVDVIVGNPPWLIYRNTASTLRTELERQSKDLYGIWVGGRHANHQDISSLFFARSVDLYLKDGGVIGMVMPHSGLQTGQHSKWRTGAWRAKPSGRGRNRTPGRILAVNFDHKTAWDLEGLEPNTFFPVPASVVFARRIGEDGKAGYRWLARWSGGWASQERMPIDEHAPL